MTLSLWLTPTSSCPGTHWSTSFSPATKCGCFFLRWSSTVSFPGVRWWPWGSASGGEFGDKLNTKFCQPLSLSVGPSCWRAPLVRSCWKRTSTCPPFTSLSGGWRVWRRSCWRSRNPVVPRSPTSMSLTPILSRLRSLTRHRIQMSHFSPRQTLSLNGTRIFSRAS